MNTNYFSITTPQGTGGIGIIELFGKDALEIVEKIFRRSTKNPPISNVYKIPPSPPLLKGGKGKFAPSLKPNRIYLGHIYADKELIDEVIIHFTPAQNSFTKLDTVEINAHGGIMPCRLIGRLLKKFGVKKLSQSKVIDLAHRTGGAEAPWRPYGAHRLDKIQTQALEYLLQAQTPLAAAVLLDQYNGALSKTLKSRKNIFRLKESARFGLALTHPRRILILGKPNVGKSTLFNALLGQDRAITHHLPGTTRDTIEDALVIGGFPFGLVDTAGLRPDVNRDAPYPKASERKSTQDAIEKIGMAYARKEIPKADVILMVVEKDEILSVKTMLNELRNKTKVPIIVVVNKMDKLTKIRDAGYGMRDNVIPISALKRTGLETLKKEILTACKLDKFRYKAGQPMVFTKRQMALIH